MNYIQEINSFYNYIVENPLTCCEQALWHRLMSYCNSFNWRSDFTLTNSRLVEDLQISRQHLDRARNTLVQAGLISYKKGTGSQCGSYHLNSLCVINVTQCDTQLGHNMIHSPVTTRTQYDTQSGHNVIPLNKLNKTKLNKTKPNTTSNKKLIEKKELDDVSVVVGVVVDCYEQNIGIVPKAVYDDISALIESDIESDLLCECIKISVFNGKPQWNYVKGIVKNLLSRDIKTLLEFKSANSKGKHTQSTSYDIAELDEFWNTVPKLEGQND